MLSTNSFLSVFDTRWQRWQRLHLFARSTPRFFFPRLMPTLLFPPVAASHAVLRVLMTYLLVLFSHAFSANVFAFWLVRSCAFIAIVLFDVLVSTFQIYLNAPYCLHFLAENKEGKTPMDIAKGTGHAESIELVSWRGFVLASGHKL